MTTRTRELDEIQSFDGSLLTVSNTLIISALQDEPNGQLVVEDDDNEKDWDAGEAATWNGEEATYLGTGTVTSGVSISVPPLLDLNLSLGSDVNVTAWEVDGQVYLHYPDGDRAALLDGLISQLPDDILFLGTVLRTLGVSSLAEYVEQNALLTFDLDLGTSFDFPVCFTRGALILTAHGVRPVEDLRVGDLVQTADNGLQPILWIGSRRVPARGTHAPVHFAAGAMGNARAFEVSQQHRMLLTGYRPELLLGQDEVLVAARHLAHGPSIRLRTEGEVEYFHLMFEAHQILTADDVESESFHIGPTGMAALRSVQRDEITALFPELTGADFATHQQTARQVAKAHEGRLMAAL